MAFFAFLGALLASASIGTIISIGLTITSALYQRRRQKKMAAELDKQKGFDLVVDGEPIHLPRVYGHQKIGGVRTYHETMNKVTTGNTFGTNFSQLRFPSSEFADNGPTSSTFTPFVSATTKNQYLMTQQALCMGGIDSIIDIEVNSQSWDKGKFKHLLEFDLSGEGTASPTATASGVVATNKFTNCAWLNATYWLNREDYNYQGVPSLSAFVKGQRVWRITSNSTLSSSKSYSNNNAECLLDYLLAPKALGGVGLANQTVAEWLSETPLVIADLRINLSSFYYAKQICDTTVSTQTNPKGRVNGMADIDRIIETASLPTSKTTAGETVWHRSENKTYKRNEANTTWDIVSVPDRVLKLYECNLTINTGNPLRDNIELFLETMGEAELVYSEGVYKLLLEYPTSDAEQANVITAVYDDSYIVSDDVHVSYADASERWNRVTVKFNNEETDFTSDSVSWPEFGDANHVALLAEDANEPSEIDLFVPGITHRELALAKAENMVRSSRIMVGDETETVGSVFSGNQKVVQLTLDKRALIHDVGDLIQLTCVDSDITNEVYKIQELNYTDRMNVEVILTRFNHTNLAYSSKTTIVVDPKVTFDDAVPSVVNLTWTDQLEFLSKPVNGYLSWDIPSELEEGDIDKYLVYTSTDAASWSKIGSTTTTKFGVPSSFEGGDRYFLVRVRNSSGVMSAGATLLVTALVGIIPLDGSTVTALPATDYITLSWSYPSDAITSQYKVYWSTSDSKPSTANATTVEQFFSATGLVAKTQYYFWIDVVGDGGAEGVMSNSFTFSTDFLTSTDFGNAVIPYEALDTSLQDTITGKADIADLTDYVTKTTYNLSVDAVQELEASAEDLAAKALELAVAVSDAENKITDAGIVVDASTGEVTIQAVTSLGDTVNQVQIDLDAAETAISLRATQTYVDNEIAAAVLDSADLAALNNLIARVDDVELTVDGGGTVLGASQMVSGNTYTIYAVGTTDFTILGADSNTVGHTFYASGAGTGTGQVQEAGDTARISLVASGTVFDVADGKVKVSDITSDITVLQGSVSTKAASSDLTALGGRVTTAESEIAALDGASITQSLLDTRSLIDEQEDLGTLTLQEVLGRYGDRKYLNADIAAVRTSLQADVNDQGVALATAKTELAALIDDNSALISSEQTARADADSAIASDVTSLTATVSGIQTDLNGVETEVGANSTAVTNLSARVTSNEGDISSITSDVTSLTATVSGIQTDLTGVETEVGATSTAVTNLTARVTSNEGGIASVASDVTSLTTTVGTNTASITAASSSINGLEAKYGVEIDNNGSISGFQLLSGAGSPSAFNVRADQFNLFSSSGVSGGTPFSVFTSSRTIDGVTYPAGTYMDDVYVQNSINVTDKLGNIIFGAGTPLGNTFIADAAITNAKISNGSITTAKIGTAQVDTLQIAGQAVTIPASSQSTGTLQFAIVDQFYTVATLTYTSSGANVLLNWSLALEESSNEVGIRMPFRLYRGSTLIYRLEAGYNGLTYDPYIVSTNLFTGSFLDTGNGSGSVTYSIEMARADFSNPSTYAANRVLTALEVKR
jgi:hypothetical protein